MARVDFQDRQWAAVEEVKLCHDGQNTLTDQQDGVEFIIGEGNMEVFDPDPSYGPDPSRLLFFTPKECDKSYQASSPIARLVIRFNTPQQHVRVSMSSDQGPDRTVNFYREHNATDLRESRGVPIRFRQGVEIVYSSTEAIKELTITTKAPENSLYELEFYESFADIQHDIALALDGSGSMSAQNKWESMIEAADIFHDLYSEVGDGSDEFGAVRFRWDCGNNAGGDETARKPSLNTLSSGVDIPATYENDSPSDCTPIGEGTVQAADMVGRGDNPANHVLLLTDGKNNRGRSVRAASRARNLHGVTVHTLGLGTGDHHIDPDEINKLATDHGGQFRQTNEPQELLDFFAESLGDMVGDVELATIQNGTVTVAPGTDTAVFLIAWDDPADEYDFDLTAPDGTLVDHTTSSLQDITVSYHESTSRTAHAYFVVDGDIQGDWQFRNTPASARTLAVEDLDLQVEWSVTPQLDVTGTPIDLEARVTYQGEPFTGDVTVTADASRPDEAQGDLLAEQLRSNPVSVAPKGDTSQRGRIISTVLERMGREGFQRASAPDLTFEAGDEGRHRLTFTDTAYDGVYRFDLRAVGTDEDGNRLFARRATRFCTLIPAIDGSETTTSVEPVEDNLYQVSLTPRTADGKFAGPFLADQLMIQTLQGSTVGDLVDNHDGSYTQLVRTDGTEPEEIAVMVQNRKIPVERPPEPEPEPEPSRDHLPWLLVLVLAALVIVLLVITLT